MRTILHISDLHFGRIHREMIAPLIAAAWEIRPDLVAVSGDLTQRAFVRQFKEARSFLDALPRPRIVVPGNHDIPLFNPVLRLCCPLSRFTRYITNDLSPQHVDDEIAVLGANTTRALIGKGGRINIEQVEDICDRFFRLQRGQTRIVVTHHPFDLPHGFSEVNLVGRSKMAMERFAECGVDLFLSGHLHRAGTGSTARYMIRGFSSLLVRAGTVISKRERGEMDSFNVIRVAPPKISVQILIWQPEICRFAHIRTRRFHGSGHGWVPQRP